MSSKRKRGGRPRKAESSATTENKYNLRPRRSRLNYCENTRKRRVNKSKSNRNNTTNDPYRNLPDITKLSKQDRDALKLQLILMEHAEKQQEAQEMQAIPDNKLKVEDNEDMIDERNVPILGLGFDSTGRMNNNHNQLYKPSKKRVRYNQ